ncbi:uncharacterized protein LOC128249899 isoform X2 [Octopus bimaculoides]|uniref:uncharacterized protein LOC128249899 isoform X2 n=1 Tax=Octopus bimaculoides TaxID=37653 RepID=UPI0022DF3DF5|nr:uncharacterized protein LOC128249899 isoform X2 [Octopus bimaculoides]
MFMRQYPTSSLTLRKLLGMKVFIFISLLIVGADGASTCTVKANAYCPQAKMSFNEMVLAEDFCKIYWSYEPCLDMIDDYCAGYFDYYFRNRCPKLSEKNSGNQNELSEKNSGNQNEVILVNVLITASLITLIQCM